MEQEYQCTSVKKLNAMLCAIKPQFFTDVEVIYNIGANQYYEYPLFICTNKHIFRIFFSDNSLSLHIYLVEDFANMRQDNMIHYSLDPHDFDYIWPEGYMPNAKISGVVPVKGCGTTANLIGIELQFTNGRKLCIHSSDLIPGAMDSQIV